VAGVKVDWTGYISREHRRQCPRSIPKRTVSSQLARRVS